jgi:rubrerythrin
MDDLLAMMDEDDAAREEAEAPPPPSSSSSAPMDDLLALMEDNPSPEKQPFVSSPPRKSSRVVTPPNDRRNFASTTTATNAKPADVGVDNRLGIRMLNRNMSSMDLLDLISSNPYYSPASLSAMSLAALNRLLVDPTAIVDKSTVCGKTNVVTVGVVFTNTGTRISAKGSAFCVMTIGALVSGPCLTVMLFGEPYSKYCKTCTPGKVVALCLPKLLPPKDGGSQQTSVTFAAYDARSFQLVATDKDYGTCQGSVRVKQDNGAWTPTGTCKHYVDKRQGPFCQSHRKQQYAQNGKCQSTNLGGRGGNSSNNMTFMQQMRQDHGPKSAVTTVPAKGGGNLVVNSNGAAAKTAPNRFLNPAASSSSAPNAATGGLKRQVPMHMKKQSQMPTNSRSNAPTSNNTNINKPSTNALLHRANLNVVPRIKPRGIVGAGSNPTANNTKRGKVGNMSKAPIGSDWLHSAIQPPKKQPATTKKRSIQNIARSGGGFDGSVIVPKPSRIFAAAPAQVRTCRAATSAAVDEVPVDQILNQQSELAKRLKEGKPSSSSLSALEAQRTRVKNPYQKATTIKNGSKTLEESLFGSIKIDTDKVLQAKSRFAHEADAEEYAKSRQNVLALEKLEAQKEATQKKKGGMDEQKKCVKEWTCEACGTLSFKKPNHCVMAGHTVKLRRSIQKEVTKEESRTKLNDKSVEDGGLSLGAGLEWSRFDRYIS